MDMNLETGKRERESSDARNGDDGKPPSGAVKRAWSKPRVRLVTLSHVTTGDQVGGENYELGPYNPDVNS